MNLIQKEASIEDKKSSSGIIKNSLQEDGSQARKKPQLLRINADNQDKTFMCRFWSFFILFLIIFIVIAKTLPKVTLKLTNSNQLKGTSLAGCDSIDYTGGNELECGQFIYNLTPIAGLIAKNLKSTNQLLVADLYIAPYDPSIPITIYQNVSYTIIDVMEQGGSNGTEFSVSNIHSNYTTTFTFDSSKADAKYLGNALSGLIAVYTISLGYIGSFPSTDFYLKVQFNGNSSQLSNIYDMQMQGIVIDPSYTIFTIVYRYVFFVLAILTGFLYIRRYRNIPDRDRIVEQKMIAIMSILLLFFNDPFYPITVLHQNMASSFFSILFVVAFVVYLIFLWIIFLDRILYEEGKKQTQQINCIKMSYCFVLLMLLIIFYMSYASYRANDRPFVAYQDLKTGKFVVLAIIISLWFCVAIAYMIVQYVRIAAKPQQPLWRNKLFMMYSLLFEVAVVIFFFADSSFGQYEYNGTTQVFLIGLMNLYTWFLQYMYSPALGGLYSQTGEHIIANNDQVMTIQMGEYLDSDINLDNDTYTGYPSTQNRYQDEEKYSVYNKKQEIGKIADIEWNNQNLRAKVEGNSPQMTNEQNNSFNKTPIFKESLFEQKQMVPSYLQRQSNQKQVEIELNRKDLPFFDIEQKYEKAAKHQQRDTIFLDKNQHDLQIVSNIESEPIYQQQNESEPRKMVQKVNDTNLLDKSQHQLQVLEEHNKFQQNTNEIDFFNKQHVNRFQKNNQKMKDQVAQKNETDFQNFYPSASAEKHKENLFQDQNEEKSQNCQLLSQIPISQIDSPRKEDISEKITVQQKKQKREDGFGSFSFD